MTTAHRPTWNAAVGGSEQGGSKMYVPSRQYSAKDLPGQTKMKERPQIDIDPKSNQYRAELLRREEEALAKKERREARNLDDKNQGPEAPDLKEIEPELSKKQKKDSDDESEDAPRHKKTSRDDYANPFPEDEDDEDFMKSDDEKSESSSSKKRYLAFLAMKVSKLSQSTSEDKDDDDDSDSDNERLLLEYERVKKEREEEQKRKVIFLP